MSGRRLRAARKAANARAAEAGHGPVPNYDPTKDETLAPLGIGSIGNSGITLSMNAKRAVRDVQHPLEVFHNNQDSAGRILGHRSQRALGRMNPRYFKAPVGAIPRRFDARRTTKTALAGQRHLADIARAPSAETDHNEQIWTKAPSLKHVNAVVIQKQLDRPPKLQRLTSEERTAEADSRKKRSEKLDAAEQEITRLFASGEIRHPEMVRERAKLSTARRRLENRSKSHKLVDRSAKLPKELRLPSYWADGQTPKGYEGLNELRGAGGRSFRDLVVHVPPSYKRAMLPDLAHANLQPDRPAQIYPAPRSRDPRVPGR